jgi:HEPN domain-containing protein
MAGKRHSGVSDQIKASRHRLDDAQALFEKGRWRGCMYLAGYSLECLLKGKLMQRFRCRTLEVLENTLHVRRLMARDRSVYTHDLELLLQLLQAKDRLRARRAVLDQFTLVNKWHPAWRYSADAASQREAEQFMTAVRDVLNWVANNL